VVFARGFAIGGAARPLASSAPRRRFSGSATRSIGKRAGDAVESFPGGAITGLFKASLMKRQKPLNGKPTTSKDG
jgi:hypothetical protein